MNFLHIHLSVLQSLCGNCSLTAKNCSLIKHSSLQQTVNMAFIDLVDIKIMAMTVSALRDIRLGKTQFYINQTIVYALVNHGYFLMYTSIHSLKGIVERKHQGILWAFDFNLGCCPKNRTFSIQCALICCSQENKHLYNIPFMRKKCNHLLWYWEISFNFSRHWQTYIHTSVCNTSVQDQIQDRPARLSFTSKPLACQEPSYYLGLFILVG